eukprot:5991384-Amphidinium_carterae.1
MIKEWLTPKMTNGHSRPDGIVIRRCLACLCAGPWNFNRGAQTCAIQCSGAFVFVVLFGIVAFAGDDACIRSLDAHQQQDAFTIRFLFPFNIMPLCHVQPSVLHAR